LNAAIDLLGVARNYGTPCYVYDIDAVSRAAADLLEALPAAAELYYSLKANPHPRLVSQALALGLRAEVSSDGELEVALAVGALPEQILYTGPGKTAEELAVALTHGVRLFAVESVAERDRLTAACHAVGAVCEYLVRLNGPRGSAAGSLRMGGRATAFGVDVEHTDELAELLAVPSDRVRPVGLHVFFATNVADESSLIAEFEQVVDTAAQVAKQTSIKLSVLGLGGGFPAPLAQPGTRIRFPNLRQRLVSCLDDRFPDWRSGRIRVLFESGRYLVADSGTLLSTVLDVKTVRGRTHVVIDAGVNVLGGMNGLGRLMAPCAQPYVVEAGRPGTERADLPITVVGPLCTPLDVISQAADLPEVQVGQVLAVPNVGAYGLTASLVAFLSRPTAVELVVVDDAVIDARRLVVRAEPIAPLEGHA
jgi:diaminopimelate decarboxylase